MLEDMTKETFEPHVESIFRIPFEDAPPIDLVLIEVTGLPGVGHKRKPFALMFRTSAEFILPQRSYPLEHEAMGQLTLFLVPIGPDQAGESMRYEAVFT